MITKLDTYKPKVMRYPSGRVYQLLITVNGISDIDINDISQSLDRSNNVVYLEGNRYEIVDTKIDDNSYRLMVGREFEPLFVNSNSI